jgi:hypothetical protein
VRYIWLQSPLSHKLAVGFYSFGVKPTILSQIYLPQKQRQSKRMQKAKICKMFFTYSVHYNKKTKQGLSQSVIAP